jgi:DNA polymerase
LKDAGWPTEIVVLDFECFFSKQYHMGRKTGSLSTVEYVMSPHYEELGVACLVIPDGQPFAPRQSTFWHNTEEQISWLQSQYGKNLEGATVVIQNARFDGTILKRKHGIALSYVVDVLALSRHLDARNQHNLRVICERLGLPPKGDTMQFEGLHWADMTDDQKTALASYANNDAEREMDAFALLLPRLTRPEVELRLAAHTLRLFWDSDLEFDSKLAADLAARMEAQVAKDMPVGIAVKEISGDKSYCALLGAALAETGEVVPMKQGKKELIAALAKDDSALAELKRHRNPRVRALIAARQTVKSTPLHIKRIKSMSAQAKANGGRLPIPLNYYGASTGRWSGGEGMNLQNLPTRGKGLQVEIKHCLVAPEGHVLILADAAQIEARGVAWIAGQEDLLQAFREDRDIYSAFAEIAFAAPCRKPKKDDPPPVHKLLYGRRFIGKKCILGLGYGMGHNRLLESIEEDPDGRPFVISGQVNLTECKRYVDIYRNTYRMVPKFWTDIENTFRYVVRYGQPQTLRGLSLSKDGSTVVLRLPSGRALFYPHAGIDRDNQLGYQWGKLYGGTLTENCVQAMSRDILAGAILFCEDHGFRVAFHVHDSIVVATPTEQQTLAFACVTDALKTVPAWATGWPLNVDATIGSRYD